MRLEDNGRLVALAGRGMALDKPAFRKWWKKIRDQYNVRAVIEISYKPKIPQSLIESGKLSDIQLEFIAGAGQAHEQIMPDGQRAGILCGDGIGIGKETEQAAITHDN